VVFTGGSNYIPKRASMEIIWAEGGQSRRNTNKISRVITWLVSHMGRDMLKPMETIIRSAHSSQVTGWVKRPKISNRPPKNSIQEVENATVRINVPENRMGCNEAFMVALNWSMPTLNNLSYPWNANKLPAIIRTVKIATVIFNSFISYVLKQSYRSFESGNMMEITCALKVRK
jgi:hypothetical protein